MQNKFQILVAFAFCHEVLFTFSFLKIRTLSFVFPTVTNALIMKFTRLLYTPFHPPEFFLHSMHKNDEKLTKCPYSLHPLPQTFMYTLDKPYFRNSGKIPGCNTGILPDPPPWGCHTLYNLYD